MSILASKCGHISSDIKFSKELFTEVNNNLKSFTDDEWEKVRDTPDYKEVAIAVYVRTDVGNKVLLIDEGKIADVVSIPYFIREVGVYPCTLVDAGAVCGKNIIDSVFNFNSQESLSRFVANSTCYPVGAVETPKKYVLVFNVVFSNSLLENAEMSVKQGYELCPIETITLKDSMQKAISESLILVESEGEK